MLNKIYKQLVFTVVVVLITFFGNVQTSADARSSYYLRFWCATDMGGELLQINYWRSIPSTVYITYLNGNYLFVNGMEEGIDKWNAALGCNMHPNNTSTVYSTGNIIQMFGGERNAVDGVNQFDEDILYDYDNTPSGYVDPYSRYRDYENYTCSLGSVAGYYYVFANGFVLDKGTNNDYTNHYIKTCTHELGHALGWLGHSTNSNDIMYGESTTKTQLTSRDINHIKQMYDIWE